MTTNEKETMNNAVIDGQTCNNDQIDITIPQEYPDATKDNKAKKTSDKRIRRIRKIIADTMLSIITVVACIFLVCVECVIFWFMCDPAKWVFETVSAIIVLVNVAIFCYMYCYIRGEIYHK